MTIQAADAEAENTLRRGAQSEIEAVVYNRHDRSMYERSGGVRKINK